MTQKTLGGRNAAAPGVSALVLVFSLIAALVIQNEFYHQPNLLAYAEEKSQIGTEHFPQKRPGSININETFGKLPLSFEKNQGQTDARVKFLSRGNRYTFFFTGEETVLS
ncbi:MAG: hypothetical protein M3384_01960, partial [Acidobacteriota bacterium]|nr:hypothetical protein [Acidobacteriota bacterium]